MTQFKALKNWISENIIFLSVNKYFKGVYIHFIPVYCIRIYLWGIDYHKKIMVQLKRRFKEV